MATTNLLIKGTKNPVNVYIRFTNTRHLDFFVNTGIVVNPNHWDSKNQKIRNLIEIQNRDEINSKLAKLKISVLDEFNMAFMNGSIINQLWLKEVVQNHFNRPKLEENKKNHEHHIYLTSFIDWWLKEKAVEYKISASQYMPEKTILIYKVLNKTIKDFEGKDKITFKNLTIKKLDDYSKYLTKNQYLNSTASRMIGRLKFFCKRAEAENIFVNKSYIDKVFLTNDAEEYKTPYLNEDEINTIYKKDLSYNDELDNVRDNFIIGLWTGLRVSDFLTRLKIENINDGFVEIKTKKTATWVVIPIHKQFQSILNKRAGFLPSKIDEKKFNKHIKTICQICNIDEKMMGGISTKDIKTGKTRKVIKVYKKYELITSHVCRRSFATNLFGRIPNADLMKLGGWSTEQMMLHYIKSTNKESAEKLKKLWETKT